MTPTEPAERTTEDLDAVACRFLRSEFARETYCDWPIDRRIEAYLRHHEADGLLSNGFSFNLLLERVMANIGPAVRDGVLPTPGPPDLP